MTGNAQVRTDSLAKDNMDTSAQFGGIRRFCQPPPVTVAVSTLALREKRGYRCAPVALAAELGYVVYDRGWFGYGTAKVHRPGYGHVSEQTDLTGQLLVKNRHR